MSRATWAVETAKALEGVGMQLSSWAIRRPVPTIVLFLMLSVMGVMAFMRLPVNANPNVSFPIVNVSISRSGASPDTLENSVTRRVETAVAGMAGVRHITSSISDGLSTTTVEFQLGTDTDRAVNDVRNAITLIRSELPQGIDEPVIERVDIEGGALSYYAVESPNMSRTEVSWFIDDTISKQLLTVPGVQQVTRIGGARREIRVALRPERLDALNITADQVNSQLLQTNTDVPGGRTILHEQEQSIRVPAGARDIETLARTPISLPDGRKVRLSDLADVTDHHDEIRSKARLDGREVIGFNVFRARGSSDTVVAQGVEKTVAALQQQHPDVRMRLVYSSVDNTRGNYDVAMDTLLEGATLTVLVVFLFLRSWRATLVAAIALPLSILPAFVVMSLFGYTLNSVTLLGLTLVIGILVDDAIVEIENIERHLDMGKRPYQAAIDAADAIGFAVLAITGTIVAVFLPVSFIKGSVGQYFSQFGVTVSAAVLSSLLVARLATPLLAAYILQPQRDRHAANPASGRLMKTYLKLLEVALHHRKTTMLVGVSVLVGSLALIPLLPTGFMPQGDIGMSQVVVTLPPGSTLAQTDEALGRMVDVVRKHPEVQQVYATAGSSNDITRGELLVKLVPHAQRALSQKAFEAVIRKEFTQFPNIRFAFRNESAQRDVSVILTGSDPETLSRVAHDLRRQMQGIPGAANVQIDEPLRKPELQVRLLPDEAARAGVSPQAAGDLLRIAAIGGLDSESARFSLPDRDLSVRVTLTEAARNNLQALRQLRVPSSHGGTVPLHTIAEFNFAAGSAGISRFDRERRITVEADLNPGYTIGSVLDEVAELPVMKNLPAGVRVPVYGDAEYMNEMFEQFGTAMALGVMMVLVVLVLLFNDFLQPITILVALPLSLGSAFGGLLLYGAALDLSSVIGLLMLMGIVTKNSILLVDFVIDKRKDGMARTRALLQSGTERARPIIMTTIAMAAGMVPAVFAGGSGAAFRAPMAVAVICGLVVSTALSLVFVPVLYSLMDDLRHFLSPILARLTSVTPEDRAAAENHAQSQSS